jgi:NDP-sugar pyrophosphorylase family protein
MVLAAGAGVRLRPLTYLCAKPVVPVLNRPLLHFTLERLAAAGVTEAVVNLHHLPRTVRRALGDGRRFGLRLRWSPEAELLGTGGGLRQARRFFGDEPLLIVNGDVLFDFDLRALAARHRSSGARATLALRPNPDPRRYSPVVTARGGRILAIAGRPAPARGGVSMFTGIHVLDPALIERLPPGRSDSVRDLYLPLLAQGERLQGLRLRGAWYDLGHPGLYRRAQLALVRRRVPGGALIAPGARVHATARVRASVIGAGCVVGPGARVERSVLWDHARVGPAARVSDAVLTSGVRLEAGAQAAACVIWRRGTAQHTVPVEEP